MLNKILVIVAIATIGMKANAQRTVIVDGKNLYSTDTIPGARSDKQTIQIKPDQLAALLRNQSKLDSAAAPGFNMICVKPDMKNFSAFPTVDPTQKADYSGDNMSTTLPRLNPVSIKLKPKQLP